MHGRGKSHALIVVAEGARYRAAALAERLAQAGLGFDLRVTTLGHVQRGGAPGAFDRLLASRLGAAAVDRLAAGAKGLLMGLRGTDIVATPLEEVVSTPRLLSSDLVELARVLAR
jgi:6-phosphofructokinase 1